MSAFYPSPARNSRVYFDGERIFHLLLIDSDVGFFHFLTGVFGRMLQLRCLQYVPEIRYSIQDAMQLSRILLHKLIDKEIVTY